MALSGTGSGTDGRRRRGEDTRRALVDAAVGVVTAGGFDALTLREVAGRAGVSAASATYHFGTASALLAAVVAELEERAAGRLAALTRRNRAGELTLLDACTAYLVDLLGPQRPMFLATLELRIRVARDPGREDEGEQGAGVVDLIQDHLGNRERARELYSAVFGVAALGALAAVPPSEAELRARMARLLTAAGLPADGSPTDEDPAS
ncbi:TetR/AcrR family transcriptional regulator [Pseudonocardia phyllosphaerae]|uniref:TetR/AcrR family transcriptional regulator n=1 Tax=Pseudonocardia phyllosphaerae TaxID=3390502 RepID=UPI00397B75BF